jgi:hypothetical protein
MFLFRTGPQWVRPQNSLSVELCLVIFFIITEAVLLKRILDSIGHSSLSYHMNLNGIINSFGASWRLHDL